MAIHLRAANGEINIPPGETVQGVILNRTIQDGVKVRPTNVTAVISFDVSGDENYEVIVLQNGPKGGFTQQFLIPSDALRVHANEVIRAVVTDKA